MAFFQYKLRNFDLSLNKIVIFINLLMAYFKKYVFFREDGTHRLPNLTVIVLYLLIHISEEMIIRLKMKSSLLYFFSPHFYRTKNCHLQHLKQALCHLWPPAIFSSAAKTALLHFGHLAVSLGLNGIFPPAGRSVVIIGC